MNLICPMYNYKITLCSYEKEQKTITLVPYADEQKTMIINCDEIISLDPLVVYVNGKLVVFQELLSRYFITSLEANKKCHKKERKKQWQK